MQQPLPQHAQWHEQLPLVQVHAEPPQQDGPQQHEAVAVVATGAQQEVCAAGWVVLGPARVAAVIAA